MSKTKEKGKKGNSGKEGMLSRESNGKRGVKRKNESGQK